MNIPDNYIDQIKQRRDDRIKYSYQELGFEMQKYFKQNIWFIFYRYRESEIREAFQICQKEKKPFPYLMGILNNV